MALKRTWSTVLPIFLATWSTDHGTADTVDRVHSPPGKFSTVQYDTNQPAQSTSAPSNPPSSGHWTARYHMPRFERPMNGRDQPDGPDPLMWTPRDRGPQLCLRSYKAWDTTEEALEGSSAR